MKLSLQNYWKQTMSETSVKEIKITGKLLILGLGDIA